MQTAMRNWLVCTALAVAVTGTLASFAVAQENGPEGGVVVQVPVAVHVVNVRAGRAFEHDGR